MTPSRSGLSHLLLQRSEPNGVYESICCRLFNLRPASGGRAGLGPWSRRGGFPRKPTSRSADCQGRWDPGESLRHLFSSHRSAAKATHLPARTTSACTLLPGCSLPRGWHDSLRPAQRGREVTPRSRFLAFVARMIQTQIWHLGDRRDAGRLCDL